MHLISPAPGGWENLPFGSAERPYSEDNRHRGKDWGYFYKDHTSRRVVTPVAGTVRISSANGAWNNGWGNRVEIVVNDRVYSALNHLDTGSIRVKHGQHVNAGDLIGTMGATGDTGGTIHLHEELWIDGVRVDPDDYRNRDLPGTAPTGSGASKPAPIPALLPEEEEIMTPRQIHEKLPNGNIGRRALLVPGTAYFVQWTESGAFYANSTATNMETNSSTEVTPSLYDAYKNAAASLLPPGRVEVALTAVDIDKALVD